MWPPKPGFTLHDKDMMNPRENLIERMDCVAGVYGLLPGACNTVRCDQKKGCDRRWRRLPGGRRIPISPQASANAGMKSSRSFNTWIDGNRAELLSFETLRRGVQRGGR